MWVEVNKLISQKRDYSYGVDKVEEDYSRYPFSQTFSTTKVPRISAATLKKKK